MTTYQQTTNGRGEGKRNEPAAVSASRQTLAGFDGLSGATRLIAIVGDPIAQVKSPGGLTRGLRARGQDRIVIPVQVTAEALPGVLAGLDAIGNLDGIIATVPHKFAAFRHAASASDRAALLGSANVLRRAAGGWHADMLDGLGFVRALEQADGPVRGKRALLVGAGGAGSAIGLELLNSGVVGLAVHDADGDRQRTLLGTLGRVYSGKVLAGPPCPAGFDIVVNATPAGMRESDPMPLDVGPLHAGMVVGDVITAPEVTPLLRAAQAAGCRTLTGVGMFVANVELMVAFFGEA